MDRSNDSVLPFFPKEQAGVHIRSLPLPKEGKWKCELFGCGKNGLTLMPQDEDVPNFFWRWMQYLCFGNRWSLK